MLAKSMVHQASSLHDLAAAVGISRTWRDVDGLTQTVADEALGAILTALGHEVGSTRKLSASLKDVRAGYAGLPPLIVADVGRAVPLDLPDGRVALTGEDGRTFGLQISGAVLPPLMHPGYYDLEAKGQTLRLAIAPLHCPRPTGPRPWGTSLQIPSLRGPEPGTFGHFGDLAAAAAVLARVGASAVAINPVHALFPGVGEDFSPYSPSSRLFLNTAMGDPALVGLPPLPAGDGPPLIET
jgi:4-alpha-glucanotransferase